VVYAVCEIAGRARSVNFREWRQVDSTTTAAAQPPGRGESRGQGQQSGHGGPLDEGAIRSMVERARAGEPGALASVLGELRPDVVRLCARLLGADDAEDAANEACMRAQDRLASYDHGIDQLRRRSVEQRLFEPVETDLEALPGRDPSALEGLIRSESQAAVQDALDRLPERYRAPLALRYMADLDYNEIGAELGLERGQVATLLFRGKRRMRELLRGEVAG